MCNPKLKIKNKGILFIAVSARRYAVPGVSSHLTMTPGLPIPEACLWGKAWKRHYKSVLLSSKEAVKALKDEIEYSREHKDYINSIVRYELSTYKNKDEIYSLHSIEDIKDVIDSKGIPIKAVKTVDELQKMSIVEIRTYYKKLGIDFIVSLKKEQLIDLINIPKKEKRSRNRR